MTGAMGAKPRRTSMAAWFWVHKFKDGKITGWPLVGNEGMNPQYTNVKVDSLIPY